VAGAHPRADCSPSCSPTRRASPRPRPGWDDATRALLHRPRGSAWTPADVPLLEEAEELLGFDDSAQRARAERDRRRRLAEAQETLDVLHGSRSIDLEDEHLEAEVLSAGDLISAEELADRQRAVDTRPPPSGPQPTAPGPSGTSSSTRPRSSPPWPGGCWSAAAPPGR
jgi:hypothetical protein